MKLEAQAAKWFADGVKKSAKFQKDCAELRRTMMDAAFDFLRARECVPHGQWLDFLELHRAEIKPRTVQFWMRLAEDAKEWVLAAQPGLKTVNELHAAAREMIFQSPKGLVTLGRELGQFRRFGEYDAVKYAQRKLGGGAQIEFDFASAVPVLDALCRFGDEAYDFIYPAGVDEENFLDELETKLDSAIKRVRQVKQRGRAIEA